MAQRYRQHGYVLLMTLLLILMAGVFLAAACRWSLDRALTASRQEQDLQTRWGVISCRTTLLPQAFQALDDAEQRTTEPVTHVEFTLTLSGQPMKLVFFDEQAKTNLNAVYRNQGLEGLQQAMTVLLTDQQRQALPVVLRPLASAGSATPLAVPVRPPLGSFGQVFETPDPARLLGQSAELPGPAGAITLWGSGQLQLRRAAPEAIERMVAPVLGTAQINQLRSLHLQQPGISVARLLDLMALPDRQRKPLERVLTDQSECFSLWIVTGSGSQRRYHLAVSDLAGTAGGQALCFSW